MRRSARVIVLDGRGRVLLLRARDPVGQVWLLLPGGSVEAGETEAEAACRELYEETGLRVADVGAPVAVRENEFSYGARVQRQHEAIYAVRLERLRPRTSAMLEEERGQHLGYVWWTGSPAPHGTRLHPPDLASLVDSVS